MHISSPKKSKATHQRVLISSIAFLLMVAASCLGMWSVYRSVHTTAYATTPGPIKYVWIILEENTNWTGGVDPLQGNLNAPYINTTLLPRSAYATNMYDDVHPSLPNYLEREAGTSFGITDDYPPKDHVLTTTDHLVTYLKNAGYSWKAYLEGASGTSCPFTGSGQYVPRHNGTIYFADVNGNLNASDAYCISHERPYSELAGDLQKGAISNFNYIVPDLCHDFHGGTTTACGTTNYDTQADDFLKTLIPEITATQQYQTAGAIILSWDEGRDSSGTSDNNGPLPFMVLSPFGRGGGYSNTIAYTHYSTLKTLQEIFGLTPLLGHAGDAATNDLSDLFQAGVIPASSSPPTPTTTPTPAPTGQVIAQDTFQRPNQTLWGTASDGPVWAGAANKSSAFSINTEAGRIHTTSAGYLDALLGPSETDAEVVLSGSMSNLGAGANTFGPVLRWTNAANLYRAMLTGSSLVIQKVVGGAVTNLKSVAFPAKTNTRYFIRFNVTGTTLAAKAWQAGAQEPTNWMVTVTDSRFSSGSVGLRTYSQSGVTTTITSFEATQ